MWTEFRLNSFFFFLKNGSKHFGGETIFVGGGVTYGSHIIVSFGGTEILISDLHVQGWI